MKQESQYIWLEKFEPTHAYNLKDTLWLPY